MCINTPVTMFCTASVLQRNGALRKKYDSLKYTLQKMENTLYELSLTDAMGFKKSVAADEPMVGASTREGEEGEEGA